MAKRTSLIFATYLRDERMLRDWRREDLANISGVSKSALSRYETDEVLPPRDVSDKLAEALGQDRNQFWGFVLMNEAAKKLTEIFDVNTAPEEIADIANIFGAVLNERRMAKVDFIKRKITRVFPKD